jgi:aminopeptidase N
MAGIEKLIERAAVCAGTWAPGDERARLRADIAAAALRAARAATGAGGSVGQLRRVLAGGFAANAESPEQLALLGDWLRGGSLPSGVVLDAELRGRVMVTLAARGLAEDGDIEALRRLDPVGGELHYATCRAARPDPATKETAWHAALSPDTQWQLADAHARGIWIPGQERLMASYRDRYFAEALPALGRLETRLQHRLGRLLFPSTLADAATIKAAEAAAADQSVTEMLRVTVAEEATTMRRVLRSRCTEPGPAVE